MTLIEEYKNHIGRPLTSEEIDVINFAIGYMHKGRLSLIEECFEKFTPKDIKNGTLLSSRGI